MMKIIKGALKEYNVEITDWDEPTIRVFDGREVQGRPTKGYGTATFDYAGKKYEPEAWTQEMKLIKMATELLVSKELERVVRFNFCLCGLYEGGDSSIPHHSDTVPTLNDLVVGVSFGSARILQWRQFDKDIKKESNTSEIDTQGMDDCMNQTDYMIEHGDVYIFDGHSQMNSTHSIPAMENTGQRINLTFRTGL
jgi:alkylated DNA repair dioxygenase AlkB|tara:strand:+ start:5325 stop:5909 length:585 start_codon:yes stop_codon:yes gene_type:complete